MDFNTHFTLNREHYAECFDQSMLVKAPQKPRYLFMAVAVLTGLLFLFFSEVRPLLAWFFFGLAILEFFSFKYRRAWWLTRQMISKNAGNQVTLIFDEDGIENKSVYMNSQLAWQAIERVFENEQGYLLNLHQGSQQYLSKSCLNEAINSYIRQQLKAKKVPIQPFPAI